MTVTSPSDGAILSDGSVTIAAVASDAGSGMDRVVFKVDGATACTALSPPYGCTTVVPKGTHTLTVTAVDRAGNTSSAFVTVTRLSADNTPPTLTITSPQDGAKLHPNGHVTIAASAADGGSGVNRVEFAEGSALACTATASPYVCDTQVAEGTHVLTVTAVDNAGNRATDSVTVSRGNNGKKWRWGRRRT